MGNRAILNRIRRMPALFVHNNIIRHRALPFERWEFGCHAGRDLWIVQVDRSENVRIRGVVGQQLFIIGRFSTLLTSCWLLFEIVRIGHIDENALSRGRFYWPIVNVDHCDEVLHGSRQQ